MPMSKDRVHFELQYSQSQHAKIMRAFKRAFNTTPPPGMWSYDNPPLKVICRPSQFARFLIYRNEEGAQNMFKELNAVLKPEVTPPAVLDVSTHENVARYTSRYP